MPRKRRFILAGTVGAIVVLIAIGVFIGVPAMQPGVLVIMKNSDPAPITNVQVFLGGKVLDLGSIAPGATASGRAIPSADSDVSIQYLDASGAQQSVRVDTYVTGGYRGRVDAEVRGGSLASSRVRLH